MLDLCGTHLRWIEALGNYSHYLIYAASSLAEQSYPLALLIDDSDASVSSIHFHGQEPRDSWGTNSDSQTKGISCAHLT